MGIVNKLKDCAACKKRRERLKRMKDLANERIRQVIAGLTTSSSSDK
jgi:hypothetical protein